MALLGWSHCFETLFHQRVNWVLSFMRVLLGLWLFVASMALCQGPLAAAQGTTGDKEKLVWEIKRLTVDANEGIDLADFNNDGQLDVIAGRNWYAAPEFTPRPVRTIEDWNGYVQSNGDFACDVDNDGWIDVISGSFNLTEVYWYRNPGQEGLRLGHLWEKHLLVDTETSKNEGQLFQDLDGDGKQEWIVNSWAYPVPLHIWRLTTAQQTITVRDGKREVEETRDVPALEKYVINQTGNGHGLGVGDINGDGLDDIVCATGWYECPGEQQRYQQQWTYHADWEFTSFSLPVLIRDLDGDGRNDIVWGSAHEFGLQWWQQQDLDGKKTTWKTHLIDDSFSQAHALAWADLDGDGKDDLITGKRVLAHNGGF